MTKLEKRHLGRTGLTVTRLGAGGHFTNGPLAHEDIPRRVRELNHLLDLGVSYFDVQWDPEELATAEVLATRSGEFTVGISFEYRANSNKAKGAPIDLVFPKEGLGWDLEAFAIHKGTKKLDAAKKLADWASSKDAMLLYGKNFAITAQPGVAAPLANVPKDYEARLVKLDFNYAAEQRERILKEWTARYDGKTEKR